VRHVWLVDPEARTLEVFLLEAARYTLIGTHTGMARVRAAPFEALELELAFLWGEG
jgi:Uma2 family endonuclease